MSVYLYLEKEEFAKTWVNGGKVPIKPASYYLSDERDGTKTPDENRIYRSSVDITSLGPKFIVEEDADIRGFSFIGCTSDGVPYPDIINAYYYKEDGLILSFCNHFSIDTAHKLGKVICVEICDVRKTKREIDAQLGIVGNMKKCKYTDDHQRDHFLKFKDDSWQDEFRIFWDCQQGERWVTIPPDTAKIIWTL